MLKYDNTVSSTVDGKPIYGAQVSVFTADDPNNPQVASLFSDEAGTVALSQPVLTDQVGYFSFYIPDGKYDIRVMTGAVEISRTNITMVDTLALKSRALVVPVNEDSGTLPPAGERAGKLLAFDSDGGPTMAVPNSFEGPTGPSNNTRLTLSDLKAAATTDKTSLYDSAVWTWTPGDFSKAPAQSVDRDIVKADTVPLAQGAWVRPQQTLYAFNFGVRDDPNVGNLARMDQTAVAQAFINFCASQQRVANFGGMRVGISNTIRSHSTPIVFDNLGNFAPQPGFYPRDTGTRYWAVQITGAAPGTKIAVRGYGATALDANGALIDDTRPKVNGVLYGAAEASDGPFFLSVVDSTVVTDLAGTAIGYELMFDCVFSTTTVERCGTVYGSGSSIDVLPAFAVNAKYGTCNESVWSRLQVELCVGQAIFVHPNTLSCNFGKIHSEGAVARVDVPTWLLSGGGCSYGPTRLDASVHNFPGAPKGTASIGGSGTNFTNLRVEVGSSVYSVLQNGTVTLIEPYTELTPAAGQNGSLTVIGGVVAGKAIDGYATFYGTTFSSLSAGFAAPDAATKLVGCRIASLTAASNQAAVDLRDCGAVSIDPQMFRSIRALGATELRPVTGNSLSFGYQYLMLDTSARIAANTSIDFCGFEWRGTIVGTATFTTALRTVVGADAKATGAVTGYTPPTGAEFIGAAVNGQRTKSPGWIPGGIPGWLYATADSAWHPEPVVA